MTIIQILSDSTSYKQVLYDVNQGAQIVGTILIVVYVIYTYKTFKEIKKQNDYQQDAYLSIATLLMKDLQSGNVVQQQVTGMYTVVNTNINTKYIDQDLHAKMKAILKPIFTFEDTLYDGNYFAIRLTNYGKAEIRTIQLKLNIVIKHSKELAESKMLKESMTHEIVTNIDEIIGRDGGQITIPLISTGAFPIYEIKIDGTYEDVRGKKYVIPMVSKSGENKHLLSITGQRISSQKRFT